MADLKEDVVIHMMGGGTFHALIGEGDMSANERCTAVYALVADDLPIYGSWTLEGPLVCLRIAGRHAIRDVQADDR